MSLRQLLCSLSLSLVVSACGNSAATTADAPPPPPTPDAAPPAADIALSTAGTLGAHLVTKDGKALYFFVVDTAGASASTCTTTAPFQGCITAWPAFDVASPVLGAGLTANDFSRFDRGGGVMQTTFKGRPLYTFASDPVGEATGEAAGQAWFVARPYDVFFGTAANVMPVMGTASAPFFLTTGGGQTMYVFATDTQGVNGGAPTSSCLAAGCYGTWPLVPVTTASPVLPSTLNLTDFSAYSNPGPSPGGTAQLQVVFKGAPLYFFAGDKGAAGSAAGATKKNWYTVSAAFTTLPAPM